MSPSALKAEDIFSFSRRLYLLLNERGALPTLAMLNDGTSLLLKLHAGNINIHAISVCFKAWDYIL